MSLLTAVWLDSGRVIDCDHTASHGEFLMSGLLRMLLAFAVLVAAGYGVYYLWTGTLPPHTLKIAGSYGVIVLVTFVISLITKPAGENH